MRTTFKVAELATFLYALLCFESYCINAVYYSVFGIDISAYMSISEILLLFLAQPILYVPIIISVIGLIFLSNLNDKPISIQRVYTSLALRDDVALILIVGILFVLVKVWYDIPLNSVIYYTGIFAAVFCFFIPSFFNSVMHVSSAYTGFLIERIQKRPRVSAESRFGHIKEWFKGLPSNIKSFPKNLWKGIKRAFTVEKRRQEGRKEQGARLCAKAGLYRAFTHNYQFSKSEVKRIRWMYKNPILFYFLLVYALSIVVMCSANYSLAYGLKKATIEPLKTIAFSVGTDKISTLGDKNSIYIGESSNFIFLYDRLNNKATVYDRKSMPSLSFHVEYPSFELMKQHFHKGVDEYVSREFGFPSHTQTDSRDTSVVMPEVQEDSL